MRLQRYVEVRPGIWRDSHTNRFVSSVYRDPTLSSGWRFITGRPARKSEIAKAKLRESARGSQARRPIKIVRKLHVKKKVIRRKRKAPYKKILPECYSSEEGFDSIPDEVEIENFYASIRTNGMIVVESLVNRFRLLGSKKFSWAFRLVAEGDHLGQVISWQEKYSFTTMMPRTGRLGGSLRKQLAFVVIESIWSAMTERLKQFPRVRSSVKVMLYDQLRGMGLTRAFWFVRELKICRID